MKWISVENRLPDESLQGQNILVIVNGHIFIAYILPSSSICLSRDSFLYNTLKKTWESDERFGKPTHWMPLPEVPSGMD